MGRTARIVTAVVGTAATLALAATVISLDSDEAKAGARQEQSAAGNADKASHSSGILLAHGADRHPSETAADWVTYADHVVEVTPVTETRIEPDQEAVDRGEGLILRDVKLRVDRVLWSSEEATETAPQTFNWTAHGWMFGGGEDDDSSVVTEMAGEGEPRMELGHHYIMAIEWQEPRCGTDDGDIPGQWRGLGSGSSLPYDASTIGQGEFEGTVRSADAARAAAAEGAASDSTVLNEFTGGDASDLVDELTRAEPVPEEPDPSAPPVEVCG
ncbi:hypothetical protein SHKM778_74110 [Streptomyces sp. KM77-8]|uniref:Uncharacterized protein n=1 Tax=Streptomyces haneummycinicus TaxID=3074435 RepID=A0AAT9HU35_9ACTN